MRKFLILLGFSLTVLVVIVGLAEVVFRVEANLNKVVETRSCRRQSQRYHHELVPNTTCRSRYPEWDRTFTVNNLGFRDEPMTIEKPEGTFRILLVGDSFMEGESVNLDQTAAQTLERELTETMGESIEVVNMGVMSYSPIIYQRVIEDKGLPLDPDLVIVAVDMSDFQNDYSYSKDLDGSGNFRNILFQQKMGQPHVILPGIGAGVKFWLRTNSVLYSEAADRIKQLIRKVKHLPEPTVFKINDPASDPHFVTRFGDNALRPEMWEQFGVSMVLMDRLLKQANTPWLAVIYPYGHQVAADEWKSGRLRNGFEAGKVYPATAAEVLLEFGRENGGFKVVNLVREFRRAAEKNEEPLYYPDDGHFTVTGHRVFAEALEEVVSDYLTYGR